MSTQHIKLWGTTDHTKHHTSEILKNIYIQVYIDYLIE